MIQSMTGYGAAQKGAFRVEIRSLNHRYMDMAIRIPSALSSHDMTLREVLKKNFKRGKFDVFINVQGESKVSMTVNKDVAHEVYRTLKDLHGELGMKGDITLQSMLGWRELFLEEEVIYEGDDLLDAFSQAVEGLKEMRLKEGGILMEEIRSIADNIGKMNDEIDNRCPSVMGNCKEKFISKLRDLLNDTSIDEGRILQEASSLAEKADITEEVARIKSHMQQIEDILGDGDVIGRKLDFLFQELHREANTIASKTGDQKILASVIEIKSGIEKAREQAQNIQ